MRSQFAFLISALLSTWATVAAAETTSMLSVPFERSDPMWLAARNSISASVACVTSTSDRCTLKSVPAMLVGLEDAPLRFQLEAVNRWVNHHQYVPDAANWKNHDYWANIAEFLQRGGDCEDYAIAKYAMLRALGIPASKMRLLIVDDRRKREIHAVLAVDTDGGTLVLDNQHSEVAAATELRHYIPRVAINEQNLWRMPDMPLVHASASKR